MSLAYYSIAYVVTAASTRHSVEFGRRVVDKRTYMCHTSNL